MKSDAPAPRKRKQRLPTELSQFNAVLGTAIKAAPAGLALYPTATGAAKRILSQNSIPQSLIDTAVLAWLTGAIVERLTGR